MITKEDIKYMFKQADEYNIDLIYKYNKETNMVCDDDGVEMMTLDNFVSYMKRKEHCDFKILHSYDCKSAYKCNKCGTYILDNIDKDLCCPVCSSYKLRSGIYWTADDVNRYDQVKEQISSIEEDTKRWEEHTKRVESRNGLWDNQLYSKKFHTKKNSYMITLYIDDITNKFKLKGLHAWIAWSKIDTLERGKAVSIPLGITDLKRTIQLHISNWRYKRNCKKLLTKCGDLQN